MCFQPSCFFEVYLYGEFLPHCLSLFKTPSRLLRCSSRSSRLHCPSSFSNLRVGRKLLHFHIPIALQYCMGVYCFFYELFMGAPVQLVVVFFFFFLFFFF
jgi:hypothetical protein